MIDEKRLDFVQVNKNVLSIASSELYLKYIKKYLNKLLPNQISTIYNNLNFNNPQLLLSKYTTVNNESDITNYNIYSKSVIELMTRINNIYDAIVNSKLANSGLNEFNNCEIKNFTPINIMYSTVYLDLYNMLLNPSIEQLIYPVSVLILKRSELCLLYVPSISSPTPAISYIYSDLISLDYNTLYTYNVSFVYKTKLLAPSELMFLMRIYTVLEDTIPLTFETYIQVPSSTEYTSFSSVFFPAPLVDNSKITKIKISFYLNRDINLNNNIILYLATPIIWWLKT